MVLHLRNLLRNFKRHFYSLEITVFHTLVEKTPGLERMAGSQKIFRVHTPFKRWVQSAQSSKTALGVHKLLGLGYTTYTWGISGCTGCKRTCHPRPLYIIFWRSLTGKSFFIIKVAKNRHKSAKNCMEIKKKVLKCYLFAKVTRET